MEDLLSKYVYHSPSLHHETLVLQDDGYTLRKNLVMKFVYKLYTGGGIINDNLIGVTFSVLLFAIFLPTAFIVALFQRSFGCHHETE
jgi:hypothetical protein